VARRAAPGEDGRHVGVFLSAGELEDGTVAFAESTLTGLGSVPG